MSIRSKGKLYNLIWAVLEKVLQISLTLFMTGIIARYFGVEEFGYYQYSLTVLFIATTVTWLCPSEIFYSNIDSKGDLRKEIIATSVIYRLVISLITYIAFSLYFYTSSNIENIRVFILITLVSILFSEPLGIYRILLECKGYYYITSRIRLLSLISKVLIVFLMIKFNVNYELIVLSAVQETIITSFLCFYFYKKIKTEYNISISDFNFKWVITFFNDGVKFWLGLLAMNLFTKIDRFFMEKNLTPSEFGHYSASLSTYEQYVSIATILIAVLAPMVIYRSEKNRTRKNTLNLSIIIFCLGLIGAIILYFTAQFFITLIYGAEFLDSVRIFKFFILFGPIAFLDLSLTTLIIKDKASSFFTIKWLSSFIVAFLINKCLFEYFNILTGFVGYASGITVSLAFSLIYILVIRKNEHKENY